MSEDIPLAQKARTITHMNTDHRLDLQHILQHYLSLPPPSCPLPEMLDISLTSLTVRVPSTGVTYEVPFNPPLSSWADRRTRLVEMTHESRKALGIPSSEDAHGDGQGQQREKIRISQWTFPRPVPDLIVLSVCGAIYAAYIGAVFYGLLDKNGVVDFYFRSTALPQLQGTIPVLGGAIKGLDIDTVKTVTTVAFYLIAVPHIFEMVFFAATVLPKHNVTRGAWWAWTLSVLVEGFPAQERFKVLAAGEKRKLK